MIFKIAGRVRGLFAGNYPENREDEQFHLNSHGDQIVAQGLPPLTELVRLGDSWQVINAAGVVSANNALPTTAAGLAIWNGEPAGGKSYVIDSVACTEILVDTTQVCSTALFVMNNKTPVAAPTDDGLTIRSLSGKAFYGGKARTQLVARTVVNDGWYPAGNSTPPAAAIAGSGWKQTDVNLNGMYIVPPSGQFNVYATKVTTTAAQLLFTIRWHEVQLIVRS